MLGDACGSADEAGLIAPGADDVDGAGGIRGYRLLVRHLVARRAGGGEGSGAEDGEEEGGKVEVDHFVGVGPFCVFDGVWVGVQRLVRRVRRL